MPRVEGYVTTASASEVPVNGTTYTEQTSGAQRSLKSGSANDAAAGTGARKVRITFYSLAADGTLKGPYTEDVTLNGVTAVPTVSTNIALIEKLEVLTVGSGGVNAGVISLYTDNAGVGSVIASIATGDRKSYLGLHYVPSGVQCELTDVSLSNTDTTLAQLRARVLKYGVTGAAEAAAYGPLLAQASSGLQQQNFPAGGRPIVVGPARIELYVTPGSVSSQTTRASLGYVERTVDLTKGN